jgi:hypothetical protein
MTEKPRLKLHDLLYVPDEQYRASLDRATAQGLLRDNWTDLCDRKESFWDEYQAFVAQHFPESIPFSVAKGNRKDDLRNERRHVPVIKGLVRSGASINLVYEGKTALDYAIENHEAIPYERMSGNRDYTRAILECLRDLGAVTAAEVSCSASL